MLPTLMTPQGLVTWIVIGVMALTMGTSFAFEEPSGFKEVKFGDSEQTVRSRAPGLSCYSASTNLPRLKNPFCTQGNKIGDIPVVVRYTFRADRLVDIQFTFEVADYPAVTAAFASRFGTPSSMTERILTTGRGREYLNEERTWDGPVVRIFLSKYLTATESIASYRLRAEDAAEDEAQRARGAKGAEDLK